MFFLNFRCCSSKNHRSLNHWSTLNKQHSLNLQKSSAFDGSLQFDPPSCSTFFLLQHNRQHYTASRTVIRLHLVLVFRGRLELEKLGLMKNLERMQRTRAREMENYSSIARHMIENPLSTKTAPRQSSFFSSSTAPNPSYHIKDSTRDLATPLSREN